jgi:iron complex outermembrane receptor protein
VFARFSGRQDETAMAETSTAGFTSVGPQLGSRPLRDSVPGLELTLVGRDLTDSIQRNAVALNKDDVILPGRDVRLGFRATF